MIFLQYALFGGGSWNNHTCLTQVINRRSTEGLSFTLAAVSLVCSSLWMCYGLMLGNPFIYVPNVMGVLFSVSQVCRRAF